MPLQKKINDRILYINQEICKQCGVALPKVVRFNWDPVDFWSKDTIPDQRWFESPNYFELLKEYEKDGKIYIDTPNYYTNRPWCKDYKTKLEKYMAIIDGENYHILEEFPYKWLEWNFEEELAAGLEAVNAKLAVEKEKEALEIKKMKDISNKIKKEKQKAAKQLMKKFGLKAKDVTELKKLILK